MTDRNVYAAIAAARKGFAPIRKTKTNPHFKSKYADLDTIEEAIRPALAEAGLEISHAVVAADGRWMLQTSIIDTLRSAQALASSVVSHFPLPDTVDPQKIGAAMTYGRRYNTSALLDLCTDEDDDGNAAAASQADRAAERPAAATTDDDPEKKKALAKMWKKLTEEFGDAPPWEDKNKMAVLEATFGTKSSKAVKALPTPEIIRALKEKFLKAIEIVSISKGVGGSADAVEPSGDDIPF